MALLWSDPTCSYDYTWLVKPYQLHWPALREAGDWVKAHPEEALRGTLRDQTTQQRRPFIRFFACGEDLSHDSPADPLPARIASGSEPLLVVGAMAGG